MPLIKNVLLSIDRSIMSCETGDAVKQIQEWLCLDHTNGNLCPAVTIDGQYGPSVVEAVRQFQRSCSLPVTGVVDPSTFAKLVGPMTAAIGPVLIQQGFPLAALVVEYAKQHLLQHPVEVGGQNRGPWVRLYMGGHEGDGWPWCAGFAGFCIQQACEALGRALPFELSYSCTALASITKRPGLWAFVAGEGRRPDVGPGSLFLRRKAGSTSAWEHTGVITYLRDDSFDSIEGNTNDEGSREGYEVCARVRSYKDLDFIRID